MHARHCLLYCFRPFSRCGCATMEEALFRERGIPMKTAWYDLRHALCMGLIMPMLVTSLLRFTGEGEETPEFTAPETWDSRQQVTLTNGETQSLEDYLVSVLLGEIPADFSQEALKAQAVAARTYTRKAQSSGRKHGGALCTRSVCCQAYCPAADFLQKGGDEEAVQRVQAAVKDTDGLVLTYDGDYIEATFFSCSGGKTEDAVDVWGVDYPYLQSTDSPGEENAKYYRETLSFSREELEDLLGVALPDSPTAWAEKPELTQGGGVKSIVIGGSTFSGVELRKILGLRSAAFTVEPEEDGLIFETRGYGHRVGLSQFGADAMAREGATFWEILAHYYPGTQLKSEESGKNVEK